MPTLSSLLLQRGVATLREIDAALAQQVVQGGDLATNLLETANVDEQKLLTAISEVVGLVPLPAGAVPAADPYAVALVPVELAQRYCMIPLHATSGALVVAVGEPLPPNAEEDLSFALSMQIQQRVSTQVRIRQAIAQAYGVELERRILRLVARLGGLPDPSPSLPPAPRPPGEMPIPLVRRSTPPTAPPGVGAFARPAATREPPGASAADRSVSVAPIVDVGSQKQEGGSAQRRVSVPAVPAAPREPAVAGAPMQGAAVAEAPQEPAADFLLTRQRPGKRTKRTKGGPRRRGPFTLAMAQDALGETDSVGVILRVLFDFARQFFEYAALFVVHGDLAEGVEAIGPGADSSRLRGIGVPLEISSILSAAREKRAYQLIRPSNSGIDAFLRDDLQRPMSARVLVVPVVVGPRVVALLYGDDGANNVKVEDVGDVLALALVVGKTLESLIRRRKASRRGGSEEQPSGSGAPHGKRTGRKRHDTWPMMELPKLARAMAVTQPGEPAANEGQESSAAPYPVSAPIAKRKSTLRPGSVWDSKRATASFVESIIPANPLSEPSAKISPAAQSVRSDISRQAVDVPALAQARETSSRAEPASAVQSPLATSVRAGPTVSAEKKAPARPITRELPAPPVSRAPATRGSSSAPEPTTPVREAVVVARVISIGPPAPIDRMGEVPVPERRVPRPSRPAPAPPDAAAPKAVAAPPPASRADGVVVPHLEEPLPARAADPTPDGAVEEVADADIEFVDSRHHVVVVEPDDSEESLEEVLAKTAESWTYAESSSDDKALPPRESAAALGAVAEGPRPPPKSHPPAERDLPLVIVDLDGEVEELLKALVGADAKGRSRARAEILRMGKGAAPTVARRFPGPIPSGAGVSPGQVPLISEGGPVVEVAVALGEEMSPLLCRLAEDARSETRFWAMLALVKMKSARALAVVVQALSDRDGRVRLAAVQMARILMADPSCADALRDAVADVVEDDSVPIWRRLFVMEALGAMGDPKAVPILIGMLGSGNDAIASAAHEALRGLSLRDLPRSVRKWNAWWNENRKRSRMEWLIDALDAVQESTREQAARELLEQTGTDFGFRPDMTSEARATVQAEARAWLERKQKRKGR